MTVYDPTVWVNGVPPAVNATNLNKIENGIDTAHSELAAHIADVADPHSVTKTQVGLSNVANIKVKLNATTAPTVTDDSDAGYGVQSRWTDITLDKEYVCLDASVGAAVWTEITGGAAHDLGGASHNADTLANLNSKVSDATLIDTADSRLSDDRNPTAHATEHVDGTDDIRDATNALKGLATPAQITALEANSTHKTSDGSDHTFIDQSVISGASPTFNGANITNVDADTLIADVKEANVSAVKKGQPCAIVGSSGAKFEVQLADCDDANLIRILGLSEVDTAQNEIGTVIHKGLLINVDTQTSNTDLNPAAETWAAGEMLYVSQTLGGLTKTRPTSGRCIKACRSLKGNSASDTLLIIAHTNSISACAASGEDLCNRMGDSAGVNKCFFKDYANNEVAAFDSNGNLTLIGTVDGIDVATDVAANTAKDTNVTTDLSEGTNTETTVDVNSSDGTNATLVSASALRAGLLTKAKFDEIVANTSKNTNVTTNLSEGTNTETTVDVNSSDGTNATLVAASTSRAGLLTKAKFDEIVVNNAKVTNATHTGDVTGSEALTVDKTAISGKEAVTAIDADYVLIGDTSDAGNLKKALVSDFNGGSSVVNIELPAEAAYLPATNPAALVEVAGATTYAGWSYLAFDDTTAETAIWRVLLPDYDGGNIVVKAYIKPATTPDGTPDPVTVAFDILTIGIASGETWDTAVLTDAANESSAIDMSIALSTGNANTEVVVGTITINPDNVSFDEILAIGLRRNPTAEDVTNDHLEGDAQLLGINIEYTRS